MDRQLKLALNRIKDFEKPGKSTFLLIFQAIFSITIERYTYFIFEG